LPSGVAGDDDVCTVSYVTTEKRSLPLAAGATITHVNGVPVHAGLLGVKLLAIDVGVAA
jgi:hypothetical protein